MKRPRAGDLWPALLPLGLTLYLYAVGTGTVSSALLALPCWEPVDLGCTEGKAQAPSKYLWRDAILLGEEGAVVCQACGSEPGDGGGASGPKLGGGHEADGTHPSQDTPSRWA